MSEVYEPPVQRIRRIAARLRYEEARVIRPRVHEVLTSNIGHNLRAGKNFDTEFQLDIADILLWPLEDMVLGSDSSKAGQADSLEQGCRLACSSSFISMTGSYVVLVLQYSANGAWRTPMVCFFVLPSEYTEDIY